MKKKNNMSRSNRIIPFVLCAAGLVALATACGRGGPALEKGDHADFVTFYERFHRDSAFQMAHILFPLQGLPVAGDTAAIPGQTYFWQEENWRIQGTFDEGNSEFTRTITPYGPDIMVEEIVHQNGEIGMLRRWARLDSTWYLVYYAGLNPIAPRE